MSDLRSKLKWSLIGVVLPVAVILLAALFRWSGAFHSVSRPRPAGLAEKRSEAPFEYDLSSLKRVDPSLVKYAETDGFPLSLEHPFALAVDPRGRIFVSGVKKVALIDSTGRRGRCFKTRDSPLAMSAAGEGRLVLAYPAEIAVFDLVSGCENVVRGFSNRSILTSVVVDSGTAYVADAGLRCVHRVAFGNSEPLRSGEAAAGAGAAPRNPRNSRGKASSGVSDNLVAGGQIPLKIKTPFIEGTPRGDGVRRFVVPSPFFDVALGIDDSLWVADTGRHELDNFSLDGRFRSSWKAPPGGIEGFLGCCNPAHFAVFPNGDFVTVEKGVVRVKIYGPDGVFKCVVAPPAVFAEGAVVTDIAVSPRGEILLLESKTRRLRVFKRVR